MQPPRSSLRRARTAPPCAGGSPPACTSANGSSPSRIPLAAYAAAGAARPGREYPPRVHLSGVLEAVMGRAARRPLVVGLVVGLLAAAGGALALARLEPSAATDTLVGRGTQSFAATETLHQRFGDDAVYVLIRQPLTRTVLTSDLLRVLALEGCLSGNAPKDQAPRGGAKGPCAGLARTKPVKVVFGPGTFLNEAVGQIQDQFSAQSAAKAAQADRAAKAARALARSQGRSEKQARKLGEQAKQLVFAEFIRNTFQLALKYGITSAPQLNDPSFI